MRLKRSICGLISLMAVALSVNGCTGKDNKQASNESGLPKGEIAYPMETDEKLTYWVRLTPSLGTSVQNLGETPFAKELSKRTGIEVEYKHAAQGQEGEVLNLLIAAGDLPDIIETNWLSRDPENSMHNGTILNLNEYFKDYSPNLMRYLEENPEINRSIRTDEGNYYAYPFIRGDEKLLSTEGFMLRSDWLKEFGLSVPETIDEWNIVLESFKTKCETPLAMGLPQLMYFAGAYNTANDFYIDNGKVQFGAITESFRDCLATLNDWYKKGYIDKNFPILDSKLINANMLQGVSGITFGAGGGTMGVYLNSAKDPNFDLSAAPFPTSRKGETPEFGNKQFAYSPVSSSAITKNCKNPALAARFLDYSYSEEGHMLNNFGIENESYTMEDGSPKYTGLITKNPEGLAMSMILPMYTRASYSGSFVQDKRYIEQYYGLSQQLDALNVWSDNNHEKHALPQVTLTQEETGEFSSIMSEVRTYRDESIVEFILGSKPLDEFDAYVKRIKDLKVDKAIAIEQAAYDRFISR